MFIGILGYRMYGYDWNEWNGWQYLVAAMDTDEAVVWEALQKIPLPKDIIAMYCQVFEVSSTMLIDLVGIGQEASHHADQLKARIEAALKT